MSSVAVAAAVSGISVTSSNFAQIPLERVNFSHPQLGVNSNKDFIIHLFLVGIVGERSLVQKRLGVRVAIPSL